LSCRRRGLAAHRRRHDLFAPCGKVPERMVQDLFEVRKPSESKKLSESKEPGDYDKQRGTVPRDEACVSQGLRLPADEVAAGAGRVVVQSSSRFLVLVVLGLFGKPLRTDPDRARASGLIAANVLS
jgi:hypothetical protein